MTRQPAGSRSDPEMTRMAASLASTGLRPPQILKELERQQADEKSPLYGRTLLSLKVIRGIAAENPPPSPTPLPVAASDQWNATEDQTGNPALVLAMLRELIEWANITHISRENAARLVTLAP